MSKVKTIKPLEAIDNLHNAYYQSMALTMLMTVDGVLDEIGEANTQGALGLQVRLLNEIKDNTDMLYEAIKGGDK